jgi:hypothetical protein
MLRTTMSKGLPLIKAKECSYEEKIPYQAGEKSAA